MSERGEKAVIIIHFSEGYELASMGQLQDKSAQAEGGLYCQQSRGQENQSRKPLPYFP